MSTSSLGRVAVFFVATPTSPSAVERREHCKISPDLAAALGIPSRLSEPHQVRLGVTAEDVSASTHGSYASHLGTSAVFTVDEIIAGTGRVEIHPNSAVGGTDGGVFKLFAADLIPVDARVTLWNAAPSVTVIDDQLSRHYFEPAGYRQDHSVFAEVVETGVSDLLVFAPHGGDIEAETSAQLIRLRSELHGVGLLPSLWDCRGTWQEAGQDPATPGHQAYRRWHIASGDIQRASFPGLDYLMTAFPPFRYAVALHGFRWQPRLDDPAQHRRGIVIGGRAPLADKLAIRTAIEATIGISGLIAFYIADEREGDRSFRGLDGDLDSSRCLARLRATSAQSIVNRLSPNGIQIEQSRGVRTSPALHRRVTDGLVVALEELLSPAHSVRTSFAASA